MAINKIRVFVHDDIKNDKALEIEGDNLSLDDNVGMFIYKFIKTADKVIMGDEIIKFYDSNSSRRRRKGIHKRTDRRNENEAKCRLQKQGLYGQTRLCGL